jgi:pyrimidine operon attenuation protein / uracil phosphoribosyltransferase
MLGMAPFASLRVTTALCNPPTIALSPASPRRYFPAPMPTRVPLMDDRALARTLARMATEIVERAAGTEGLVLVGIQRRGVELAARLRALIAQSEGAAIPLGKLDITLYRDDLQTVGPRPVVGETSLPDLDGKVVAIVDDVLYTGRTVRAALDECSDFGRPRRILLCVLIDRGGRELPIQADIVGKKITAGPGERVDVLVSELDGRDAVELVRR